MCSSNFALSEGKPKQPRMPEALKARDCQYPSCEVVRMKIGIKPWSLNNLGEKSISHLNTMPRLFAPPPAPQGFLSCSLVLSILQVGSGGGGLHWRSAWPPAGCCPPATGVRGWGGGPGGSSRGHPTWGQRRWVQTPVHVSQYLWCHYSQETLHTPPIAGLSPPRQTLVCVCPLPVHPAQQQQKSKQ